MADAGPLVTTGDGDGNPLGGSLTTVIPPGAATTVVRPYAGRLCRVVVTAVGSTGIVTFYDNPATGTGTVLFVVPATATLGTSYDVSMPALTGITAVATASGPALTVAYS
jgi:hypothetical protein